MLDGEFDKRQELDRILKLFQKFSIKYQK